MIRQWVIREKHDTVFSPVQFPGVSLLSSCVSCIRSPAGTESRVRSSWEGLTWRLVRRGTPPRIRPKARGRRFSWGSRMNPEGPALVRRTETRGWRVELESCSERPSVAPRPLPGGGGDWKWFQAALCTCWLFVPRLALPCGSLQIKPSEQRKRGSRLGPSSSLPSCHPLAALISWPL